MPSQKYHIVLSPSERRTLIFVRDHEKHLYTSSAHKRVLVLLLLDESKQNKRPRTVKEVSKEVGLAENTIRLIRKRHLEPYGSSATRYHYDMHRVPGNKKLNADIQARIMQLRFDKIHDGKKTTCAYIATLLTKEGLIDNISAETIRRSIKDIKKHQHFIYIAFALYDRNRLKDFYNAFRLPQRIRQLMGRADWFKSIMSGFNDMVFYEFVAFIYINYIDDTLDKVGCYIIESGLITLDFKLWRTNDGLAKMEATKKGNYTFYVICYIAEHLVAIHELARDKENTKSQ